MNDATKLRIAMGAADRWDREATLAKGNWASVLDDEPRSNAALDAMAVALDYRKDLERLADRLEDALEAEARNG